MRIAVTGTPGTGKTTAVERADIPLSVVHLNERIRVQDLTQDHDDERDSLVADLEAVRNSLADETNILFESHLAHHFPADRVIVLRCAPATLAERLRNRGESEESATENAESEALDVILSETVQNHDTEAIYEIDTTDRSPESVARDIEAVVDGERDPAVGTVDFTDYL